MSTIFCEFFVCAGHFSWKSKDENLQKNIAKILLHFSSISCTNVRKNFALGDCGHKQDMPAHSLHHCLKQRFFVLFLKDGGKNFQKGRKGAGVKGAGVANCRIFRSAVPSVVVWSILLVSLSGVKKKL